MTSQRQGAGGEKTAMRSRRAGMENQIESSARGMRAKSKGFPLPELSCSDILMCASLAIWALNGGWKWRGWALQKGRRLVIHPFSDRATSRLSERQGENCTVTASRHGVILGEGASTQSALLHAQEDDGEAGLYDPVDASTRDPSNPSDGRVDSAWISPHVPARLWGDAGRGKAS
jgi:hypothetical protein